MADDREMLARLRVPPHTPPDLADRDPADRMGLGEKGESAEELEQLVEEMRLLQNRLYAEADRSVLLILQSMDAGGKNGTIRRVFSGVNPQGCRVAAFKEPTRRPRDRRFFAPWYLIPADRKGARDVAVARLLVQTLRDMDPHIPEALMNLEGVVVE